MNPCEHNWKLVKLTDVMTMTVLIRCTLCGEEKEKQVDHDEYCQLMAEAWKEK